MAKTKDKEIVNRAIVNSFEECLSRALKILGKVVRVEKEGRKEGRCY